MDRDILLTVSSYSDSGTPCYQNTLISDAADWLHPLIERKLTNKPIHKKLIDRLTFNEREMAIHGPKIRLPQQEFRSRYGQLKQDDVL